MSKRADMPQEKVDRLREQRRARYAKNPEVERKYQRAYRADNLEVLRERDRRNSPARREYQRQWRAENSERVRAGRKARDAKNKEVIRARKAQWLQDNLDRHRVHQHNRRARMARNGGSLSPDIAKQLLHRQGGLCACCGRSLADGYDIDHIVPISKGGMNVDANVQLLTPQCNRRKGDRMPDDYAGLGHAPVTSRESHD